MMLAYRRGLLEPGYKFGLQSRLREKMILQMLDMETGADALEQALTLRCMSIAPSLAPEHAIEYIESLKPVITHITKLREYDISKVVTEEEKLASSSANLAKAFAMLSERGIIEEFKNKAAKAMEEHLAQEEL